MRIVLQRHAIDETAQHYGLSPAVINAHLDKKAAAHAGTVVNTDVTQVAFLGA
jgi:hypothetical protein